MFPEGVKEEAGHGLWLVQNGEEPGDWDPIPQIGPGACEIRADDGDAYRVIYVVQFEEAIYVLHAFMKKSKSGIATPKKDLNLAKQRYAALVQRRKREAAKRR